MKKNMTKTFVTSILIFLSTGLLSAQINLDPKITNISSNTFVLVTKENPKFEKPQRVIQPDFQVSGDEAFDPQKINSYPKWQIKTVNVSNNDGTSTRQIALLCLNNNKYFNRSGYMVDAAVYDKFWEKDATGKYINDQKNVYNFLFIPEIKDETYLWLRYYKDDKTKLVVTQSSWNTRSFKLVLVK